jgi:hypothetical protein
VKYRVVSKPAICETRHCVVGDYANESVLLGVQTRSSYSVPTSTSSLSYLSSFETVSGKHRPITMSGDAQTTKAFSRAPSGTVIFCKYFARAEVARHLGEETSISYRQKSVDLPGRSRCSIDLNRPQLASTRGRQLRTLHYSSQKKVQI